MKDKIKVVWLCHFSNAFVHERLDLGYSWLMKAIRKLIHKPLSTEVPEFAIWITNAIREFEKIDEVELHIVSPYPNLKNRIQEFSANQIHYHFFRNESDSLIHIIYRNVFRPNCYKYKRNRRTIVSLVKKIKPEIVHLFGAENPHYSLGILDIPKNIITIAQLQTLLNDPDFKENYPIDAKSYQYRAGVEMEILGKVDYIGTMALKYREIIKKELCPDAIVLDTNLALNEPVAKVQVEKEYDFVYFSADISKAADMAIEAFGIAYQQDPHITLDVIGGYDIEFKHYLDSLISRYGIGKAVTFEGKLPTHDDVISQIRKSRFALLPLKIDLTSGTIREAMANGLPVLTTDTGEKGTQRLNITRQSVLISPIGDHQALATNIFRILNDEILADTLCQNAFLTSSTMISNELVARDYIKAYKQCIECCRNCSARTGIIE